jgi:surface antigen
MPMNTRRLVTLTAIALLAVAPAAQAFNYRFLQSSVLERLTPEDIDIGTRATGTALNSGQDGEWTNPATGASGTIRVLETVDVGGHKGCRRVRLDVTAGGRSGGGNYTLCKSSRGTWKFYTPPR